MTTASSTPGPVVRIDSTSPSWEASLSAWADYARALKAVEEARRAPEQPPWHTLGQAIVAAADAYKAAMNLATVAFAEAGAYASKAYEKDMTSSVTEGDNINDY